MESISYAYGTNHFLRDPDLAPILERMWPDFGHHRAMLATFGDKAGGSLYETAYHVDHESRPVLVAHNLEGQRIDRVRLAPAERQALLDTAFIMEAPYNDLGWMGHYALLYLLADPGLACILTITNQTAYALHKYGTDIPEADDIVHQLIQGRAWGATWMTEVQGGSDLGANQTRAVWHEDMWRLSGDKYFASGAGLTDFAIVTARPEGAGPGPKGLALFLLPRLRRDGGLNFHVRRLKDKSATRAVPSGEVELFESEAYLIGEASHGIYYTLENLNVSRLANAAAAMGIAAKARLEVWGRVRARQSFGQVLIEHPLIRRDLTDIAVRMAGGTALAFASAAQFNRVCQERPPYSSDYHQARFMTHLAKSRTAEHSAEITRMAMELFGGLGFLDEYAVSRWHREALITPIWEGPSNIQALDFLETVRKGAHRPFLAAMESLLRLSDSFAARHTWDTMRATAERLERASGREAEWLAKEALTILADGAQVALLYDMANGGSERCQKLAELYHARFLAHQEYPAWVDRDPSVWGEPK